MKISAVRLTIEHLFDTIVLRVWGARGKTMNDTTTYEFRWDVEVPGAEPRFGQRFMKQWKRVLQAQRMSSLVSHRLSPRAARFQVCVPTDSEVIDIAAREAAVAAELAHLRWPETPEGVISPESPDRHPAGWQGVRVWMTFERQDVETALARKSKL